MDNNENEIQINSNATVIFEALLGFAGILLGWIFGLNVLQMVSFRMDDILTGVIAVLPLLIVPVLISTVPLKQFREILEFFEKFMVPSFRYAGVQYLLLLSLLSGLAEELLFRGFIQSIAVKYLGIPGGIAAASFIFGITHLITPVYAGFAALMGAWLGFLFVYTENLIVPVVIHFLYNFIIFIYYLKIRKRETV